MAAGYKHPDYAKSLGEFGIPWELPKSGGWILKRQIPGFLDSDAMGCYPLFTCQDWSQLHSDLEEVGRDLVSLCVVTDPFGKYEPSYLDRCFKDFVIRFKEHFIVDLARPMKTFVSSHHRRYARKALQNLCVEKCENPSHLTDEWVELYDNLINRHNIRGIQAFSRNCFNKQLRVPGIVVFRATHNETTVGMLLWYIYDDVAYYHLGAFSTAGYKLRASFALFWTAIEYFADHSSRWLNLGAGAGVTNDTDDGLTRFKRGWSTNTQITYFCGRIFNPSKYSEIVKKKNISSTHFFPAYRTGEFT